MTRLFAVCIFLLIFTVRAIAQQAPLARVLPDFCLTPTEAELYHLINTYREQKGLPSIKLSFSLCYVAKIHAKDQAENHNNGNRCNMHSWSKSEKWSSCCYTPDHK